MEQLHSQQGDGVAPAAIQEIVAKLVAVRNALPETELDLAMAAFRRAADLLREAMVGLPSNEIMTIAVPSSKLEIAESQAYKSTADMYTASDKTLEYCEAIGTDDCGSTQSYGTEAAGAKKTTPRVIFQTTNGFTMFTRANELMLQKIADTPIQKMPEGKLDIDQYAHLAPMEDRTELAVKHPEVMTLYAAMRHIASTVPAGTEAARIGTVTPFEMRRAIDLETFEGGFEDTEFAWHFSAGVANAMADHLVAEGRITAEQKRNFTLADWAGMIGSSWFGRAMQLLALAPNGAYADFGNSTVHYREGRFLEQLTVLVTDITITLPEVFVTTEVYEPSSGRAHLTVMPSPKVIRHLRSAMQLKGNSAGCPVARRSVSLSRTQLERDRHAKWLIEKGILHEVPERSNDERVRLVQEQTTIDNTLALFAKQLADYEASYGTPSVSYIGKRSDPAITIHHTRRDPANVLSWLTKTNS